MSFKQLELEVHDTDEQSKKTTNCEAVNDEDVYNLSFSEIKVSEINVFLSLIEKVFYEIKKLSNKQS